MKIQRERHTATQAGLIACNFEQEEAIQENRRQMQAISCLPAQYSEEAQANPTSQRRKVVEGNPCD